MSKAVEKNVLALVPSGPVGAAVASADPSAAELPAHVMRAVLMASPAITYVYDPIGGKSLFQNRSLRDLLGHPPDPFGGSSWIALMHPDDRASFPEYREHLKQLKAGEEKVWEYRLRTPEGGWRWFESRDVAVRDEASGSLLIVGNATDITEHKKAKADCDLLLDEMKHRSKNFAAVIHGLASQSAPADKAAADAFKRLVSRLMALLGAGDIILASDKRTAGVREVIENTLRPFAGEAAALRLDGPEIIVSEKAAGSLALAIHELATNAIKYGAFAQPDGSVEVAWTTISDGFRLSWRESTSVQLEPGKKDGFGTRLLKGISKAGSLQRDYDRGCLTCSLEIQSF
jgi:PAS domain S-box-containing protein